ncbi:isoprenylcysteine carboxylmethyltransferase family protein [Candidatus Woesearchaeota archaeon]|nr:isoprenylcysteine carboxylmethyltransferase family protein [Candidatus Woesearchaeota archaeon]
MIFGFFSAKFLGKNKDDFWVSKKKEKRRTLITNGPYSKIRHPIYTSMILYYFGLILVFFHLVTFLFYVALLIVIIYTAISEENFLRKKFPEYENYMKDTGRFLPKFSAK